MGANKLVENGQEISYEEIWRKVRELQVQIGVHIKDLETKCIAVIKNYNEVKKEFYAEFIEHDNGKTYSVDSYLYEFANEKEVTTSYYRKAIKENNTPAKNAYDLGYIYDIEAQCVVRVIDIATANGIICSRLTKEEEGFGLITENTNMKGYFLNIDAFEITEGNWRVATPEEIEFFKKKANEAHEANYLNLKKVIPFEL